MTFRWFCASFFWKKQNYRFEEFCCEVKNLIAKFHVENQKPLFIFNFVLRVFYLTFWMLCAWNRCCEHFYAIVYVNLFVYDCVSVALVAQPFVHCNHSKRRTIFSTFQFCIGEFIGCFRSLLFELSSRCNNNKKSALCMWFYSCQAIEFQSKQLNISIRNSLRFIWELRWKSTMVKHQKPISLS